MKIINRTHLGAALFACFSSLVLGDLGDELLNRGYQVFKGNQNVEDTILFTKAAARYYELESRTNNVYYATSLANLASVYNLVKNNDTAKYYYSSGLTVYKNIKKEHLIDYRDFLKEYATFAWNRDQSLLPPILDEMLSTISDDNLTEKEIKPIIELFLHSKNERSEYAEIRKLLKQYSEDEISFTDMRVGLLGTKKAPEGVQPTINELNKNSSVNLNKPATELEEEKNRNTEKGLNVNRAKPSNNNVATVGSRLSNGYNGFTEEELVIVHNRLKQQLNLSSDEAILYLSDMLKYPDTRQQTRLWLDTRSLSGSSRESSASRPSNTYMSPKEQLLQKYHLQGRFSGYNDPYELQRDMEALAEMGSKDAEVVVRELRYAR